MGASFVDIAHGSISEFCSTVISTCCPAFCDETRADGITLRTASCEPQRFQQSCVAERVRLLVTGKIPGSEFQLLGQRLVSPKPWPQPWNFSFGPTKRYRGEWFTLRRIVFFLAQRSWRNGSCMEAPRRTAKPQMKHNFDMNCSVFSAHKLGHCHSSSLPDAGPVFHSWLRLTTR